VAIIKPLLAATLETALNQYLSLDEGAGSLLEPLAGRVIAVTVQPFSETFYLCPTHDGIQILDAFPDQPDTHLTGSPWALGLMGISNHPMRALFSGRVSIAGDIHVGHRFQELFAKLNIDLEAKMARYTGGRLAHGLFDFVRIGQDWSRQTLETLRLNTSEFLQEETRELPSAPELSIFYRQVDKTRTDYDRLQSRVERLTRALASASNTDHARLP